MQLLPFTKNESAALLSLAVFGLIVPNGVFIYCFVTDPGLLRAALSNPLALVFMLEAAFLMLFIAWLVRRGRSQRLAGLGFIVMSLVGSLAFSVPASLWLLAKNSRRD